MASLKMIGFIWTFSLIFALKGFLLVSGDPTPEPKKNTTVSDLCKDVTNKEDPKASHFDACVNCVKAFDDEGRKFGCWFYEVIGSDHFVCRKGAGGGQTILKASTSNADCVTNYNTQTSTPGPESNATTTTTTTTSTTTTTTTPAPGPSPIPGNVTTTTTTTTPIPPKPSPTTPTPSGNATTVPPPPSHGSSFSFANFLGGIVFTLALSSLAYVIWRFYKARNPNYHTF